MKKHFKEHEDTTPKLEISKKKQEDFVRDKKEETMTTAEKGRAAEKKSRRDGTWVTPPVALQAGLQVP